MSTNNDIQNNVEPQEEEKMLYRPQLLRYKYNTCLEKPRITTDSYDPDTMNSLKALMKSTSLELSRKNYENSKNNLRYLQTDTLQNNNSFNSPISKSVQIPQWLKYDKNVLKAGACVTLLQKIPNKPKDNKIVTHYLLACFININEETAEQILKVQNYEKLGIEESQVMKLLDVKLLQKKYTPEEINEFSLINK